MARNGLLNFTLFVILPTEDVCSLRNLASGVTVREVRSRLELLAGIPAQIYRLVCSDNAVLHEELVLVLEKNVWDGFIVRIQLHESWIKLYRAVISNDVDYVIHHGAVHCQNQMFALPEEEAKFKNITLERGFVALYIASYFGHLKMCQTLLSLGVDLNGKTPFGRTPLHGAVCRDQDRIMDILIQHGGFLDAKDTTSDNVEILARKCFAKQCIRKLRVIKLQGSSRDDSSSTQNSKGSLIPSPPRSKLPPPKSLPPPRLKGNTEKRYIHAVTSEPLPTRIQNGKEEVTSSLPYFTWDTDTPDRRSAKSRLSGTRSVDISRVGTANSRHGVKWDDTTARVPERHTPTTRSSSSNQHSILKNVPTRRPVTRESYKQGIVYIPSPPNAPPSEYGSQYSIASAPGVEQNNSNGANSDARSVESAPELQTETPVDKPPRSRSDTGRRDSGKRSRTRLLVSRHRNNESWRTMKRRIQLAENKKRESRGDKTKKRESFEDWLQRKRKQEKRDSRESDSDGSDSDTDSGGGNSHAFKEWLKEQRMRDIIRPSTVTVADLYRRRTRPIKNIVSVNDPPLENTSGNENIAALRKWREQNPEVDTTQTTNLPLEKKKLEEKRQRLLARAVSYDEWMEHTESRKKLMQQILKADMLELERIEEARLKQRTPRQLPHHEWKNKIDKREASEKLRKEKLRIKQEEEDKFMNFRSSASLPHEIWLRKKEEETRLKSARAKEDNSVKVKSKDGDEVREAFESWLERKHKQDVAEIQTQIKRERDMIKMLRDRRLASVTMC